jgi:hypothetical protein
MTEDDLTRAQELFRVRKDVAHSLEVASFGTSRRIKFSYLDVAFEEPQPIGHDGTSLAHGRVNLDNEGCAAMCKFVAELLTERLKDIDASLRAFGCEPPKGTAKAMARLRP